MAEEKKSWANLISQTILSAVLAGACALWWQDRQRIDALETEITILTNTINEFRSDNREKLDIIWREILVHDGMLKDQHTRITEVITTRDVIFHLAGLRIDPETVNVGTEKRNIPDRSQFEEAAASIEDDDLNRMIEQKGARWQQQQQQQQQQ